MVNNQGEAKDKPVTILQNYENLGLDALVCIGGNGTMKTANMLSMEGLNVVGIPKTIDNDVWGTDVTFGFESAVDIATEAIDRLHTTANSAPAGDDHRGDGPQCGMAGFVRRHRRRGRHHFASGTPYNIRSVCKKWRAVTKITNLILSWWSLKGLKSPTSGQRPAILPMPSAPIPGWRPVRPFWDISSGGSPAPFDRILATRYGAFAAQCIAEGNFGTMASIINNKTVAVPLSEVGGKTRLVQPDDPLVIIARRMGISFGDEFLK